MKKMGGEEEAGKVKQAKCNSHYLIELPLPRGITALAC